MSNLLLFHSRTCPSCIKLMSSINQPEILPLVQDCTMIVDGEQGALWKRHNVEFVPTLVDPNGSVLVGNEVHDWLKNRMERARLDPEQFFKANTTQKKIGNRRFVIAIGIVLAALLWRRR